LGTTMLGALPAILPLSVTGNSQAAHQALRDRFKLNNARFLVTTPKLKESLAPFFRAISSKIVTAEEIVPQNALHLDIESFIAECDIAETAFVQYSSGTTGVPKGLMVTQYALYQQVNRYAKAIDLQPEDVSVSWSPLYHDQGLVSNLLMPLSQGIHSVLMSPRTWLRKPVTFFQAIDRHQGSISRWPNFGFLYMASRVTDEQMDGLSLKTLRLIANSGEPITPDAWLTFRKRFESFGLTDNVMNGSFGMAENCLCVAISPQKTPLREETLSMRAINKDGIAQLQQKDSAGSQTFVSCGKALEGTTICIFDENGQVRPDRLIGEIGIKGDCLITRSYPDQNLPQSDFYNGFYRTGDMGYLADGWLTVTGRKKDIIIIGGNNINPEQVERSAAAIPGIRAGRLVALGLPDEQLGTEKLIVVCELNDNNNDIKIRVQRELQEKVQKEISVWVKQVLFREKGWIEKTTSGKLSRNRSRNKLLGEISEASNAVCDSNSP
ncbi:MAG: AMP-binding protein, partial [Arenicellales bacterium]